MRVQTLRDSFKSGRRSSVQGGSRGGGEREKVEEERLSWKGGASGGWREGESFQLRETNTDPFGQDDDWSEEQRDSFEYGGSGPPGCGGEEHVPTRRDSGSPLWWDPHIEGGGEGGVLLRGAALWCRRELGLASPDLSRRYSYFLDFIDDICSGASCSDPGRKGGGAVGEERPHRPAPPPPLPLHSFRWGEGKQRLVLALELEAAPRPCTSHPAVAVQCTARYPTLGPTSFLLLHSCPPPSGGDPPGPWYHFL